MFFLDSSGSVISKSATYREDHPALSMSLVKSLDGLPALLNNQMSLTQILEVPGYSEVAVYKAIHFLLTKGLIIFAQQGAHASPKEQLKFLKKIWKELEHKNSFEVVAYIEASAGGGSLDSALAEFMAMLGDQPLEVDGELHSLWNKVTRFAEEAVAEARDSTKVKQYREASQKSEAEAKLKASSLLEDAKKALHLNQFPKALEILSSVASLNPSAQYLHLYGAWAKLGAIDPAKKTAVMKEAELEIMQIPPDERYDVLFPFVVGLFNKAKGDFSGASKSFEKSIALDSSFIPARRELSLMQAQNKKPDVFNMDLKQVVSGFFKKR